MSGSAPLQGCSVLVVEDDYLQAADIEDVLLEAGAVVLGPFANGPSAQDVLRDRCPDLAVLDIHLGSGTSFEVGRDLKAQGVPIVFTTGYNVSVIPPDLADAAYLTKPVDVAELVATLVKAHR